MFYLVISYFYFTIFLAKIESKRRFQQRQYNCRDRDIRIRKPHWKLLYFVTTTLSVLCDMIVTITLLYDSNT